MNLNVRQEKSTQIDTISNVTKSVQTEFPSQNKIPSDSLLQTNEKHKPMLIQCRLLLDILFPHPCQFNQSIWPEKSVLEQYKRKFGNHHCDDCITEDIPYKLIVGTSTSYRGEHIPICRNNLVPFNGQIWWE